MQFLIPTNLTTGFDWYPYAVFANSVALESGELYCNVDFAFTTYGVDLKGGSLTVEAGHRGPSTDAIYSTSCRLYTSCYIARSGDRPVGFMLALPDFNQVLKKMKGKILPMGWLKYLYYKRKITGARGLVQCVVKEYQNRGVPHAMYFETYKDCLELGVDFIEASCIDESNYASRNCIERVGGERYRTYRTYRYNF